MVKKYVVLSYVCTLLFFIPLCGQNNSSKKTSKYTALRTLILAEKDVTARVQLVQAHLHRFKRQYDTLGVANAYYFLSKLDATNRQDYADSLIHVTQNNGNVDYPAKGYLLKANWKYEKGAYKEALDHYLKASKAAKQYGNEFLYQSIRFNIGLLRNTAGERKEAQEAFKAYLYFLEQQPGNNNSETYKNALFALADSYVHGGQIDLAATIINKGIKESLSTKDTVYYAYFIITSGIHQFHIKNYNRAIDSLSKGKLVLQQLETEFTRLAIADYYSARCYDALHNTPKALSHFKNVDSILKKTEDIVPELVDTYNYLIADAKAKNDVTTQIQYINTLLKLDSIYHDNQQYLNKTINKKYDIAELISEKEALIHELRKETFLKQDTIIILGLFLIIIGIIAIYNFRKRYQDKQKFLRLLEEQKKKNQNPAEFIMAIDTLSKKEPVDIPKEVIEGILKKLFQFEQSNQFSKKYYTLTSLAKELHTNSAYLSKIINTYKNVNFANYLNNLRINYALEQLTTDKSLRSYTIEAIAKEVGFKNGQSFSTAFHKKTGLYPSYFIKQIKA